MDNDSKIVCPKCGNTNSIRLCNDFEITGTVLGGIGGFTIGFASVKEASKIGAIVGAKIGSFLPLGSLVGAGIGSALASMITFGALGGKTGALVDEFIVQEYECGQCNFTFKHEQKQEREAI